METINFLFGFSGRASRSLYWLTLLLVCVGYLIAGILLIIVSATAGSAIPFPMLAAPIGLAGLWIVLALTVKRLHDRNKSAWWLLLFWVAPFVVNVAIMIWFGVLTWKGGWPTITIATPEALQVLRTWYESTLARINSIVGWAIQLWAFVEIGCLRGTSGPNRFGPDPLLEES